MVVSLSEQISPSGRLSLLNDFMNHVNESHISDSCCFDSSFQYRGLPLGISHTLTNRHMHICTFHHLHLHIYEFSFWVHTFGYCLFISTVLDLLVCI